MSSPSTVGAEALAATLDLLSRFPDAPLKVDRRKTSIEIKPDKPEGYSITVYDEGEVAMVAAERWHTHYDDPLQVAWCVLWLLSPYYRLVHEHKGGNLVAVWIERYEATGWEAMEPAFFMNPEHEDSWVAAPGETFQRRYQQQFVLPSPVPYEQVSPGAELNADGLPPDAQDGRWVVTDSEAIGPTLY